MRATTAYEDVLLALRERNHLLRVWIEYDGGDIELTAMDIGGTTPAVPRNWVVGCTINAAVDQPYSTAELRLERECWDLSLNPMQTASPFNYVGATSPIIALNALVRIEIGMAPVGCDRSWFENAVDDDALDYREVFRGRIEGFDVSINPMVVRLRDISADVADAFIESVRIYAVGKQMWGVKIWSPGSYRALNELTIPTQPPALGLLASRVYQCSQAGNTATAEPAWPDDGAEFTDGTCKWKRVFFGGTTWAAETSIGIGDIGIATAGGTARYIATQGGDTGATEPTWPTTVGATVEDGTVRWALLPVGSDGGMAFEAVLGGILGDNVPAAPGVWTPTVSGAWRNPFAVNQMSTLEALRALAAEIGWEVRLAHNPDAGLVDDWADWRLRFSCPDRSATAADFELTQGLWTALPKCTQSVLGIRNVIEVAYTDTADLWPDGNPKRKTVKAEDSTSIAAYGRRYMGITAGTSNNINSSTEATTLANAVLSDLKNPDLDLEVEGPLLWPVEINDLIKVQSDWFHFSSDQTAAVVSYTHDLVAGKTRLGLRGKPTLGFAHWHSVAVGPGAAPSLVPQPPPGPISGSVGAVAIPGGAAISYSPSFIERNNSPTGGAGGGGGAWAETECHISTSSGFTPSSSTLKARGRQAKFEITGLTPGTTYYCKLVTIDARGNRSSPSAEEEFVAGAVTKSLLDESLKVMAFVYMYVAQEEMGVTDKIEFDLHWDTGGEWDETNHKFVAPVAGLYLCHVEAHVSGLAAGFGAMTKIAKNGASFDTSGRFVSDGSMIGVVQSRIFELDVDDTVEFSLYCEGSSEELVVQTGSIASVVALMTETIS